MDGRRSPACRRYLSFEPLEDRRLLARDFDLLMDVNQAPDTAGSNPHNFIVVGDTLYFVASTPACGDELWKTDGTAAGTVLVKDIRPGMDGSSALTNPSRMVDVDGTLYFTANDGVHGMELWKSDGSAEGTTLVQDMNAGPSSGMSSAELVNFNGVLYFSGYSATLGPSLWRSDGMSDGAQLVRGPIQNTSIDPHSLVSLGDTLYFSGWHPSGGRELWSSDGTTSGTFMLRDIRPGSGWSNPGNLTNVGGDLYFTANDGVNGPELWKSDGTEQGTVLVRAIHQGGPYSAPMSLTNVDGRLYFLANDGVHGREVWMSDGTSGGTSMVKDIFPGPGSPLSVGPFYLTAVGSTLFFVADDGTAGAQLWRSDVLAGAVMVKDFNQPPNQYASVAYLVNSAGLLYFWAQVDSEMSALWHSDGTAEGTLPVRLEDIGGDFYSLNELVDFQGTLFLQASSEAHGAELWKSDGTPGGTTQVKDIRGGTLDGGGFYTLPVGDRLYFSAFDDDHGYELWSSDGSAAGTGVIDMWPGSEHSFPGPFYDTNGTLYFLAEDGTHPHGLWKIGPHDTSPTLIYNYPTAPYGGFISDFTSFLGETFFTVYRNGFGQELWRTDGTTEHTTRVKDIYPGGIERMLGLTVVGETLFFTADDGVHGYELWKSDGTAEGTVLVKDIYPGAQASIPLAHTAADGLLYFWANDGVHGSELWKSDGTSDGTLLVKDIRPGSAGAFENYIGNSIVRLGDSVYFQANDGSSGFELWTSDGSSAGTRLLKDIRPGQDSSELKELTLVDQTLYFTANDDVSGFELWKSNGTTAGTALVRDIYPGDGSGSSYLGPRNLIDVNGVLYFSANDAVHGNELWSSDGTAEGTALVHDFTGDSASGNPTDFVLYDGRLVVSASTAEYGREVWIEHLPSSDGDYDHDGDADGADFLAWQRAFGAPATPKGSGVDGNDSGVADSGDLSVWAQHFGGPSTIAVTSAAVDAALEGIGTAYAEGGAFFARPGVSLKARRRGR